MSGLSKQQAKYECLVNYRVVLLYKILNTIHS